MEFQFWLDLFKTAGPAGTLLAGAGYLVYKKITTDKKVDEIEEKSLKLVDSMHRQLESERQENMELRNAVERVAAERNEAVKDLGELQGEVKALEKQIQTLTEQVQELKMSNCILQSEITLMHKQMLEIFTKFKD